MRSNEPGRSALSDVVEIGDVAVGLEAGDPSRASAMTGLLGHARRHEGRPEVTIRYLETEPPMPRRPPDYKLARLSIWQGGGEIHVSDTTGARAHATDARAWIGGETPRVDFAFRVMFIVVLTHLLALRERFVLHGAGIVGDAGVLVALGGSGSGKSTLALAALNAGWPVLGDDTLVLRHRGGLAELTGVARPVAVPADLRRAPTTAGADPDWRGRTELSPTCLTPGWFPVAAVLRVGHGTSPAGDVRPLGGQAALRLTLGSFLSTGNPPVLRRFLSPAAALSRLPAFDLHHGSDPRTRLAAAARLIRTLPSITP